MREINNSKSIYVNSSSLRPFKSIYDNSKSPSRLMTDFARMQEETKKINSTYGDYSAWEQNKAISGMREGQLGDFVNRMSQNDSVATANQQRFSADYKKYGDRLDQYLGQPAPTMQTDNRFEAGLTASEGRVNALLDNPDSINESAAYKWRLQQGLDALNRQLGAKGLLNSGNRLTATTDYAQGAASQEYGDQFKRLNDLLGNYSSNYISDKNANTQQYAAESNAWNQRGNLLGDIYGKASSNVNQNQEISSSDRLGWGNLWEKQAPAPVQYYSIPGASGMRWG